MTIFFTSCSNCIKGWAVEYNGKYYIVTTDEVQKYGQQYIEQKYGNPIYPYPLEYCGGNEIKTHNPHAIGTTTYIGKDKEKIIKAFKEKK
jgi:hypothetical protein